MAPQKESLNVLRAVKTESETKYEINTDAFKTVMEKVGERQFVLYSINGTTRTGKSYVLNYMIKYFESKKAEDVDWINYQLDSMFIARAGRERTTEGIHLWPEPYIVKTENGKEVAIVVMDTQGLFDENTTPLQNAFIMSVSTLCSSVMIFNAMRLLNEDILQQLQFYSNYASTTMNQDLAPEVVVTVSENSDASVNLEIETNKKSCQKLLFLMRDFELPDYGYGVHDDHRKPKDSIKNYFTDTFRVEDREDCPDENKLVRGNILGNYSKVLIYTLPDPGKPFKRQNEKPDEDFLEGLQYLIEFLVSNENLAFKKFGDMDVTGTDFLLYVNKWAEVCKKEAEGKFPSAQTMAESTAWTTYSIAHTIALTYFKKKMSDFTETSTLRKTGVPLEQLETWRLEASNAAMKMFNRQKKIANQKIDSEFTCKLVNDITLHFKNLQALNQKRLEVVTNFKTHIDALRNMRSNLQQGVKDLNEALDNKKIKRSPELTQHLKDANELLNNDKVLRLNFQLDDDVASMVKKVEELKSNNQKLLDQQNSWCSIL